MKIILSFCIFSLSALSLFGQLYFGPIVGYHAKVILNQNNYGDSELGYELDFGMEGGAMLSYQINGATGVQLNVQYSQLGQKYKDDLFDGVAEKEVTLNYVQIPLLFEWLPFEYNQSVYSKKPIIYVLVGPQVSILSTTEYTYTKRNGQDEGLPMGANSSDQLYNDLDIGGVLEMGLHMYLSKTIFLKLGVRAVGGITDINNEMFQIPNQEGDYSASRNASAGANVGIAFKLSN